MIIFAARKTILTTWSFWEWWQTCSHRYILFCIFNIAKSYSKWQYANHQNKHVKINITVEGIQQSILGCQETKSGLDLGTITNSSLHTYEILNLHVRSRNMEHLCLKRHERKPIYPRYYDWTRSCNAQLYYETNELPYRLYYNIAFSITTLKRRKWTFLRNMLRFTNFEL